MVDRLTKLLKKGRADEFECQILRGCYKFNLVEEQHNYLLTILSALGGTSIGNLPNSCFTINESGIRHLFQSLGRHWQSVLRRRLSGPDLKGALTELRDQRQKSSNKWIKETGAKFGLLTHHTIESLEISVKFLLRRVHYRVEAFVYKLITGDKSLMNELAASTLKKLEEICKSLGIPSSGSKSVKRERILFHGQKIKMSRKNMTEDGALLVNLERGKLSRDDLEHIGFKCGVPYTAGFTAIDAATQILQVLLEYVAPEMRSAAPAQGDNALEAVMMRVLEKKKWKDTADEIKSTTFVRKRWSEDVKSRVYWRTGGICYLCKEAVAKPEFVIEHVLALSDDPGNNDILGNLLPACPTCNCKKGVKDVLEIVKDTNVFSMMLTWGQDGMSPNNQERRIIFDALNTEYGKVERNLQKIGLQDCGDSLEEFMAEKWSNALEGIEHSIKVQIMPVDDMDKLIWDFPGQRVLGTGTHGTVQSVKMEEDGPIFAHKELQRGACNFDFEINVYGRLEDPGILKVVAVCQGGKMNGRGKTHPPFILLEVMDGDLTDKEGQRLFAADLKQNVASLAKAVAYMHEIGIMHRDLKLTNILYKESQEGGLPEFKVAGFGLAKKVDKGAEHSVGDGTFGHPAPELRTGNYDSRVDVFSFGKMLQDFARNDRGLLKQEESRWLEGISKECMKRVDDGRPWMGEVYNLIMQGRAVDVVSKRAPPLRAGGLVYVASTRHFSGQSRYHTQKGCCGSLNEVTLRHAKSLHKTPCQLCCDSCY